MIAAPSHEPLSEDPWADRRQQCLTHWRGALDRRAALTAAAEKGSWWPPRRQRTERELAAARRRESALRDRAREAGVGAEPGKWGILATVRGDGASGYLTVESTLDAILVDKTSGPQAWRHQLLQIRRRTGDARIAAADSGSRRDGSKADRSLVNELTMMLAAAVGVHEGVDAVARNRLAWHLPGHLRPVLEDIMQLQRSDAHGPVVLQLDPRGPDRVRLCDIVIDREARGTGLGTATLMQLCRTADAHGVTIAINAIGAGADPESYRARLREWYGRHGFTGAGDHLHRPPHPA